MLRRWEPLPMPRALRSIWDRDRRGIFRMNWDMWFSKSWGWYDRIPGMRAEPC